MSLTRCKYCLGAVGSKLTLEFRTPEDEQAESLRTAVFERSLGPDGAGILIVNEICGELIVGTKIWSHDSTIENVSTQPKNPAVPNVLRVTKQGKTKKGQGISGVDKNTKVWAGESGGKADQGTNILNDVPLQETKIWADVAGTDKGTKIWVEESAEQAPTIATQICAPESPATISPATKTWGIGKGPDSQKQASPAPSTPPHKSPSTTEAPRTKEFIPQKHAPRTESKTFSLGIKVCKHSLCC